MSSYYSRCEEGVSVETVILLKKIYENYGLSETVQSKIFKCLNHAIVKNRFNDIKFEALIFWKLIIKRELEDEGMIDSSFPQVAFSKRLKKIVTFNELKIKQCLLRVLHKLNEIGCLYVFLHIFENEPEELVTMAAFNSITELANLLINYKLVCSNYLNSRNFLWSSLNNINIESMFVQKFFEDISETIHENSKTSDICICQPYRYDFLNYQTSFLEILKNFHQLRCNWSRLVMGKNDLDTIFEKLFSGRNLSDSM